MSCVNSIFDIAIFEICILKTGMRWFRVPMASAPICDGFGGHWLRGRFPMVGIQGFEHGQPDIDVVSLAFLSAPSGIGGAEFCRLF